MEKNWYLEALEAIRRKGSPNAIHNRLVAVATHADDPHLRTLVNDVIEQLRYKAVKTQRTSLDQSRVVDTQRLKKLCQSATGV